MILGPESTIRNAATRRFGWIPAIALLLPCCLPHAGAQALDPAFEQLKSYYYGRDAGCIDRITALVDHARSAPAERPALADGLASILTSGASFDAKQFACRELAFIDTEKQLPALAGALDDDRLCHYALMALTKIPGKAVADALMAHEEAALKRNKLEILEILAERDDARAVPGLQSILTTGSFTDSFAAASALSRITDPSAGRALMTGFNSGDYKTKEAAANGMVEMTDLDIRTGKKAQIDRFLSVLEVNESNRDIRAAVLRQRVMTSATPEKYLEGALMEDGSSTQSMAADMVRTLPGAALARDMAALLPRLSNKGKEVLIAALGDRGDHAAGAAALQLCREGSGGLRLAALRALGQIGDAGAVSVMLDIAAGTAGPERDAARASLARIRGAGVDKSLMAVLTDKESRPPIVAEAITALGNRRATGAIPALLTAAANKNADISASALAVLRDVAPISDLPLVVALTLSFPADARDSGIEAAAAIARRGDTEQQRTGALIAALQSASRPPDRLALISIMDQVGGPKALDALEKAVTDPAPEVSGGAISMLANWPSDEPLELLTRVAKTSADARTRTIALRGALKLIGLSDTRPPDRTLAMIKDLLASTERPEDRRQALSVLGKLRTLEALEFAQGFAGDAAVKAEAQTAVLEIARSTIGAYPEETAAALAAVSATGDDETKKQAAVILALPGKAEGYVLAWEVSPAYQQDGASYSQLFDIAFPPEIAAQAASTPWRLMPVVTNPDQPWLLDLLALWGGEQKVAYLRTSIHADADRDLTLEMGSDDGVKAWLNGAVILSHNTARAVAPGEEKVKVHLNRGWNTLLCKITQNVQGWGACARFTDAGGAPAAGLKYGIPTVDGK